MNDNRIQVFADKVDNFKSPQERAFCKKHLKSYLRGDLLFTFGRHADGKDMYFSVKRVYMTVQEYKNFLETLK